MTVTPKVSIIVPCFNYAQYLPEALDSILNQTYSNWECIIINDGSTDRTEEVALNYCQKDNRIKYLYKNNGGPSSARNLGIKNTTGNYILPLDPDDMLANNFIEAAVALFETDMEIKVVGASAQLFGDMDLIIETPQLDLKELLMVNYLVNSCMYKRADFEKTKGYDESIFGMEDWDLWISLLKNGGKIGSLPFIGYYYRKKQDSVFSHLIKDEERQRKYMSKIYQNHIATYLKFFPSPIALIQENEKRKEVIHNYQNSKTYKIGSQINKIKSGIKSGSIFNNPTPLERIHFYGRKAFKIALGKYYKKKTDNHKFSIISNDCWGAEIYKLLDRPFNTPFIGLMLMGPCYIKLLGNLEHNIKLPLVFKKESKYEEMQVIKAGENFPLAVLGNTDIEIHFLHYKTKEEAIEKWTKRVNRIDWDNLFIKYDCGKDYGSADTVNSFLKLNFPNKLLFGKENFGINEVIVIKEYPKNAVKQFRSCFLSFNPIGWLKGEVIYKNKIERFIGKMAFKYL